MYIFGLICHEIVNVFQKDFRMQIRSRIDILYHPCKNYYIYTVGRLIIYIYYVSI